MEAPTFLSKPNIEKLRSKIIAPNKQPLNYPQRASIPFGKENWDIIFHNYSPPQYINTDKSSASSLYPTYADKIPKGEILFKQGLGFKFDEAGMPLIQ